GTDWTYGPLTVALRETRYGSFELWNNTPSTDEHYDARWITDLDLMYKFDGGYKIGIGANNLFDIYPSRTVAANPNGFAPYAGNSPFGHYGAFYYMRLGMDF